VHLGFSCPPSTASASRAPIGAKTFIVVFMSDIFPNQLIFQN